MTTTSTRPTFTTGDPVSFSEGLGARVRDGEVETAITRVVRRGSPPVTVLSLPSLAPARHWDALTQMVRTSRAEGLTLLRPSILEASPFPQSPRDLRALLALQFAEQRTNAWLGGFGLELASTALLRPDADLLPDVALSLRLRAQRGLFAQISRRVHDLHVRTTTDKNINQRVATLALTPLALNDEITSRYAGLQAATFADALSEQAGPVMALMPAAQGRHTLHELAELGYEIESLEWRPVG